MKVDADMKPFSEAESYFADAKLYLNPDNMQEVLPSKCPVGHFPEETHSKPTPSKNSDEELNKVTLDETPASGSHKAKKAPCSSVFRYVVRSNGKDKQRQSKDHALLLLKERKQLKEAKVDDIQGLKTELIMPVIGLYPLVSSEALLPKDQHKNMQGAFSPKAYRVLAKFGYDFSAPSRLSKLNPKLTGEKIHRLTEAQHKLKRQGFCVDQPYTDLGFTPDEPIRICTKKKDKCVTT